MQNDLKKWIKPKMHPFLAPNNLRAAAFLMLRARLRWQSKSQERLISHGRLAFCTATKILYLLAFISWAASSTDNVSRKSAIEEKMFWKVMLSSALIFFQQKIFARLTSLFYLYLHLKQHEKCFFLRRWGMWLIVTYIQRSNISGIFFPWLRGEVSGTRS